MNDIPDYLARRRLAAFKQLADKMEALNRVPIPDSARWVEDNRGMWHMTVDTVPRETWDRLGEDEITRLWRNAKAGIADLTLDTGDQE